MDATKLTAESIDGYGHIVHRTSKELAFDEEGFSFAADVFKFEDRERLTVGILTGKKRREKLESIERHLNTEELLVQLENDGVIYLARPSDQTPARSDVQPFLLKQGEAIVLDKGTWHWIPFPVGEECKTLVVFKDRTGQDDYEVQTVV